MKLFSTAPALLVLLCACATSRPDRFYILSAQPPGNTGARTAPAIHATLKVTLPSLVDRSQLVLNTSADGVAVLEHERWAAPLADLVTQTLSQDIERRRADIWVGARFDGTTMKISVDIVQLTMRSGDQATIEAHWRVRDTASATDQTGGEVFSAPLARGEYAAAAQALSECLGALADRLAAQIPHSP